MPRLLAAVLTGTISLAAAAPVGAQDAEIRVDPRVELLAVVNRLAGRSEYNLTRVPQWASAVDSHFTAVRDHPAVAMTRRLGFGFFIPMNLAVHLTMVPDLAERTPFGAATSLHRRWTAFPDSTRVYVELLRGFAKDSRFAEFFAANRHLIDSAQTRLRRVASSIDRSWIDRFWGGPAAMTSVLVAGLTNGGASYGQEYAPASGRSEAYAIIGVPRADAQGFPLYDSTDAPTLLHEMNHPYVTPLIRENAGALRDIGDTLFAKVAKQMRAQSYGSWDAMLNESLVRAAVPRYYLAHGDSARAEQIIGEEITAGFLWTRALVDLLGEYEGRRSEWPTIRAFMPRLVGLLSEWAHRPS